MNWSRSDTAVAPGSPSRTSVVATFASWLLLGTLVSGSLLVVAVVVASLLPFVPALWMWP